MTIPITKPAFAHSTDEPKTFAQIIAELAADHERFVSAILDFEQRFNAWGNKLDQVEAING